MSAIQGTNISAMVTPFDTADTYPTHSAEYGRGGFRSVDTVAARDAIPAARRAEGMRVRVFNDPTPANNTDWDYVGGAWVLAPFEIFKKYASGSDILNSYPRGSVLCHLGDSNTVTTGTWRTAYQTDWLSKGGIFEGWTSYNMGANGQSCAGWAASIASGTQNQAPQDYPNGAGNTNIWQFVNANPKAVHIRIGTNDFRLGAGTAGLAAKITAFRSDFAKVINFLLARTSAKIILSVPPTMCYTASTVYCDFANSDDAAARNAALRSLYLEWLNVSDRVMVVDTHQYVFGLRVDSVAASSDFEAQGTLVSDEIHMNVLGALRNAQAISKMIRPSDRYTSAIVTAPAAIYDTAVWSATCYGFAAAGNVLYILSRNPQGMAGSGNGFNNIRRDGARETSLANLPFAENILLSGGITQTTQIANLDFRNCFAYFHNTGNTYAFTGGTTSLTYRDVNGDIQIGFNGTPLTGEPTTNSLITFYVLDAKFIPRFIDKILPINLVMNGPQPLTTGATGVAVPPLGAGGLKKITVSGARESDSGVCEVDLYYGTFVTGGINGGPGYPGFLMGRYVWPNQYRIAGTFTPNATNYPSGIVDLPNYSSSLMFTAVCVSGNLGKAAVLTIRAY